MQHKTLQTLRSLSPAAALIELQSSLEKTPSTSQRERKPKLAIVGNHEGVWTLGMYLTVVVCRDHLYLRCVYALRLHED